MKKVFRATRKDQYVQTVEFDPGRYTFHAVVKGEVYSFALKTENGVWLPFDLSWQLEDGEWSRITHTFDLTEKCVEFSLFASETTSEVLIGDPMFEEGNNRSTPSVSPLDLDEVSENISERMTVNFDVLDDRIKSRVLQEDFDALGNRVSTAESTITQQADEIELKVSKDGVVSSINQTPEAVKIDAEKIEFTGSVSFSSATKDVMEDDISDLHSAVQGAQEAADSAITEVGTLNTYMDGVFKDGIIDSAEAKAIEKYLNSLNETKLSVDSSYSQLSNNEYLEGDAKTNLNSAKDELNTAYTNLVNSINTAIAGGSTTEAEKADVDAKFGLFNTALAAYQARVEEANKSIQDKLKSFSDEAMGKAGQADYLRAALQQSTEIDGGVVLGSVIAGRDASGQVRSYQNGDPDLNNTAFAAGVHDFGTEDETRTVGLNHDGSADIGVLRVTPEGKVVLVDPVTGLERLLFLEQDVPTAAYLMDAATDGGGQANPAQSGTDTFTLPNSMSVTSVNSTIAVVAAEMTLDATAGTILPMPDGTIPTVRVSVTAELLRDGVYFASLGSTGLIFISTGKSGTNSTAINKTITGCPPGNYSVRLSVSTEGSIASRSFSISTSTMTWEGVKNVNWFQFGLNGFMAWFTNNAVHFDEQNGFFAKGKTDMPGVLASGSVTAQGVQSNVWGAKSNSAGAGAISGGRSVPLSNMKHGNYVVQITPHTATTFRVGTKTISSFEAIGTGGFDYVVIGNNY